MNIDFQKLGFNYTKTNYCYISYYKDGAWDNGKLTKDDTITISLTSPALHYAQEGFEGLKAYRYRDGSIHLFRIDENAKRLQTTCQRLLMPEVSVERFIEAVLMTVKANSEFVPPYGTNATLYIRPFVFGVGNNLGLRPATEYVFAVVVTPVGPYFKDGIKPVKMMVSDYDRAAPHGLGGVKAGANYAASLYPNHLAKLEGFSECIYLDPATHTKIEEAGAANFFAITRDGKFMTPSSPSILPSITRMSLVHIAKEMLGMEVIEGDIYIDKLEEFVEAGACGTAAVITPISGIYYKDKLYKFTDEIGPISKKLYDTLVSIQFGELKISEKWIFDLE